MLGALLLCACDSWACPALYRRIYLPHYFWAKLLWPVAHGLFPKTRNYGSFYIERWACDLKELLLSRKADHLKLSVARYIYSGTSVNNHFRITASCYNYNGQAPRSQMNNLCTKQPLNKGHLCIKAKTLIVLQRCSLCIEGFHCRTFLLWPYWKN